MEIELLGKIRDCFKAITQEVDSYLSSQNLFDIQCEYKENICGCLEEVTKIDKGIERVCKRILSSQFPDFYIIAEESDHEKRNGYELNSFFAIDPVDGTLELLNGGTDWSVSLAAIADRKTQVAMLYFPRKSILLSAIRGQGVVLNGVKVVSEKNNRRNYKIGVSPRQITHSALKESLTTSFYQYVEIPHFTPKILALVSGEIDVAAYLPQKNKGVRLWDYAAASLVLHEFGGKLESLTEGSLDFGGHVLMHKGGWIAANDKFDHASLVNSLLSVNLDE
ncbi:MAG: fructose-1,6-bisphosphatase [Candidatus Electronema aureum]|uniref:Fructose-1,6-bisphosphatase n=1 Tax=Candidatus Electronema aureum TaxID=2005002 RepID=A0A521G1W7_9BACT|nr:MAG: fructose-1,6-bisphosphatase [Candidatus Electronema aureum]